jgi:membrane protein YdbS with pleckstrin-like domain
VHRLRRVAVDTDRDAAWLRPSPRLLVLRRLEVAVGALVGAGVVAGLAGSTVGASVGAAAAAVVVVAGLVAERFVRRRFLAWGYAEREDDLLVRRGVLFSRL